MKLKVFKEVIQYTNKNVGKTITNVDMECDLNHIPARSLGVYKGILRKAGYIEVIQKGSVYRDGIFKILKEIPEDIKLKDIDA